MDSNAKPTFKFESVIYEIYPNNRINAIIKWYFKILKGGKNNKNIIMKDF